MLFLMSILLLTVIGVKVTILALNVCRLNGHNLFPTLIGNNLTILIYKHTIQAGETTQTFLGEIKPKEPATI